MIIRMTEKKTLMEFSNIRGKEVKVNNIIFSFYFSTKKGLQHGIRAKVYWNREKMRNRVDGYFELHGDYKYVQSTHADNKPSAKEISDAREFFKYYKVLFAAAWEDMLDPDEVCDFFKCAYDLDTLIDTFVGVSDEELNIMKTATSVWELERLVRKYRIFNLHD